MWLATEKCYNELFSLARKVIILLISFKLPQPHVNRGVLPSFKFSNYPHVNSSRIWYKWSKHFFPLILRQWRIVARRTFEP